MKNYRLTISYDGSRYDGWEHQKHTDDTIQGKIEAVLSRMCENQPIKLVGAGRTDAGVHALAMTANILLTTPLSCLEIRDYLNRYLPDDICIKNVTEASDRFHSRYNATGKTYRYTCYVGATKPVFDRKYVYPLETMPDLDAMRSCASHIIGTHDFASFCGNSKMKKSTVRTIDSLKIAKDGDYLTFTYHGDGFLQHMIRIITGTLLEVGYHRLNPDDIDAIFAAGQRAAAGPTAPAAGLCLIEVDYN